MLLSERILSNQTNHDLNGRKAAAIGRGIVINHSRLSGTSGNSFRSGRNSQMATCRTRNDDYRSDFSCSFQAKQFINDESSKISGANQAPTAANLFK
jgi:hypothetical protein